MSTLYYFIYGVMWVEIIGAALFLAACAVGVGLWGWTRWSERAKEVS